MTLPLDNCLVCGSDRLETVLEMPHQPPANLLLDSPESPYPSYPLALRVCRQCSHGQLSHAVDGEELYGQGYTYSSGTGGGLTRYFQWFADQVSRIVPAGSRILELACNDGSLLSILADSGFIMTGVEPDAALAAKAQANSKKSEIIHSFWPLNKSTDASIEYDCIIALNVLAHVPYPLDFLKAAANYLSNSGIILVQTSQVDMPATGQFDSVYHEHISYFTNTSMKRLTEAAGLHVAWSADLHIHGRSRLWALTRDRGSRKEKFFGIYALPDFPVEFGTPYNYSKLAAVCKAKQDEVSGLLLALQQAGQSVVLLGAAAKAITALRACGVCPDHILDESAVKIGRWVPGWESEPIRGLASIADLLKTSPASPVFVLGAWNVPGLAAKAALAAKQPILLYQYFPESSLSIVSPE